MLRRAETLDTARHRTHYRPLGGLLHFFHAGGLTLEVAQEIQLGAADLGRAHNLDLRNGRRVQREDALHTLAERHLAHGEGRSVATVVEADNDALENLDA